MMFKSILNCFGTFFIIFHFSFFIFHFSCNFGFCDFANKIKCARYYYLSMKTIIGFVGLSSVGKSTAIKVAQEYAPLIGMGDIVREEIQAKALMPVAETRNLIAQNLRRKHGEDVIIHRIIRKIKKKSEEVLILKGLRTEHEIELLKEKFKLIIVGIVAPSEAREEWLDNRHHEDAGRSRAKIPQVSKKEKETGIKGIIQEADHIIENSGTIEDLQENVHALMKKLIEKPSK